MGEFYFSDGPAQDDTLGRAPFAASLAKALVIAGGAEGWVAGIEGKWGSGKSTIIGLVRKELSDVTASESKIVLVDFNPWMLSNTGALVEALVTQIAASISHTFSASDQAVKTGERLLRYVGLLKYLKYVPSLTFLGNIGEAARDIAMVAEEGEKKAGEMLKNVKEMLPFSDLAEHRVEVVTALAELGARIVVVVDDIDRLPAEEIRAMVQAVKAVANFPNTTYLLAYDQGIVAEALGSGDAEQGRAYLEKIVQVAYPIPPLFNYQFRRFVEDKIETLVRSLGIGLKAFEKNRLPAALDLLAEMLRQPRDAVRLTNKLWLSLGATRNEVNVVDVVVFEAFTLRFPGLRDSVYENPHDFISNSFRGAAGVDFKKSRPTERPGEVDNDAEPRNWMTYLPAAKRERAIAERVCIFLFEDDADKTYDHPEDHLRMIDPDRLARYFRMASLEYVPEVSDIHRMLSSPEELLNLLTLKEAELTNRLQWMLSYLPSCENVDADGALNELIRVIKKGIGHFLSRQNALLLAQLIFHLLRKENDPYRAGRCFMAAVSGLPLSISWYVVKRGAELQEKRRDERAASPEGKDIYQYAEEKWLEQVFEEANRGHLQNELCLREILMACLSLDEADAVLVTATVLRSETGLRNFLASYHEAEPFNSLDVLRLTGSADGLIKRIAEAKLADDYAWFIERLSVEEVREAYDLDKTLRSRWK